MQQFVNGGPTESMIDIKAYFYLVRSWAWLIVLAGALAGAAAYLVSVRTTPVYEASTRLLISAPSAITGVDPTSLVTTQTMTSTYSEMLLDRPVLQGVIDQLQLVMTPEDLKKTIAVDSVINTQLLVITVEDTNPGQAAEIANSMASVFALRIRELQSQRFAASRDGLAAQVSDMEQQISATSSQIAAIEQRTIVAPESAESTAQGTPAAPASPAPADVAALEQLRARLTQYRTIYSSLVTSFEQVRLSEAQTSTNVVVSEPAAMSLIPVRPKTTQNTVLAIVAGMLLAVAAVFAMEKLDDTIKNPEELRRKFNVPILGMIALHEEVQGRPIALAEPRSPTAEAFRSLRTNIAYTAVDRPLRRLMITSATPQDGKTTVASGVAVVMAQSERQVVLIDADMRRPQIHRRFGLHNRRGLSELFVQGLDAMASVIHASELPELALITSGGLPPNPSELLTSKMMGQILDKLNQAFDLIVIDTPPVLSVTDAAALATEMDGVVLVAKPGVTKLGAFQQALEQLRAVNARVLGVVINGVNPRSRQYGYYYNRYYSKYSRYYETGGGKDRKSERSETAAVPPPGDMKTLPPPAKIKNP